MSVTMLVGYRRLKHRKIWMLYLLHKLLTGNFDCKALLSQLNLRICHNTKSQFLTFGDVHRTNYRFLSISSAISTNNDLYSSLSDLDLFE